MRRFLFPLALALASVGVGDADVRLRELRFSERVHAQRAIERVYYSHQIGTTLPFEHAYPQSVIERKVRDSLKQSAALEAYWGTRITAEALRRETERMARHTRMPGRLKEVFAALGNDPVLIQECLARPSLAGRLVRSFFASDSTIHAPARQAAERLRQELGEGLLDPHADHPRRVFVTVRESQGLGPSVERERDEEEQRSPGIVELPTEEFDRWKSALPPADGLPGLVQETADGFQVQVPLARRHGEVEIARYSVPKLTWDAWWDRVRPGLDETRVPTVAVEGALEPIPEDAGCAQDSWGTFGDLRAPDARTHHSAVWTGSEVIVWGGYDNALGRINTGGRYDPVLDTWTPTSLINAPTPRELPAAVWTGDRMLVWGGNNAIGVNTGGQYDPLTDTWSPTSTVNAPSPRIAPAVWTGDRMLVWGGSNNDGIKGDGASYDPASDVWTAMSGTNAPSARYGHTSVWTSSQMAIWGGSSPGGALYDPGADEWTAISEVGAPEPRSGHTSVWTGTEMIVWGGACTGLCGIQDTGGRYDPASQTWQATSVIGAPAPRRAHTAVWTDSRMVVWGGAAGTSMNDGGIYDPFSDSWTATALTNAPAARLGHTATWTGNQMVVWGGLGCPSATCPYLNSGGRFDPSVNAWTPTFTGNVPYPRAASSGVWTGSHLIVWGGENSVGATRLFENTGGLYDPATDTWSPTALAGAPEARSQHTAIWAAGRMVVWGGAGSSYFDTGGRYDPLADTWTPTSIFNAPPARNNHTAVWTGSRMIVWGGNVPVQTQTNTGGRYDPITDTWTATSMMGVPSARAVHSAVWTGARMIIWGGTSGDSSGGRYDPAADSWQPTNPVGALSPRSGHAAVWTGNMMLIWGGAFGAITWFNDGRRYNPTSDIWTPISMMQAPSPRSAAATLWTGTEMIIWGGSSSSGVAGLTGGRYDPVDDSWTSTTITGAPSPRYSANVGWTGSLMLLWGGYHGRLESGTGYTYCGCIPKTYFRDLDGDGLGDAASLMQSCTQPAGFVRISGDCNDASGGVWRTPGEVGGLGWFNSTALGWNPVTDPGSTGVTYDLLRSSTPSSFVSGVCLASGIPGISLVDAQLPPIGGLFGYLVRAHNGCPAGAGPLGSSSSGVPRVGFNCP